MAQTVRIQAPRRGTFTCNSSTAEEAVEYLRQVLDEPWHGQKLLSCGPQKLSPQELLHEFNDLVFTNYSYLSSGPPVRIPRAEVRGITIEQLSRLLEFVEERAASWCESFSGSPDYGKPLSFYQFNRYHVNEWVVGPATGPASSLGCSYVELVAREAASQRPLWYVAYVWLQPLHEFITCLRRHASLRELPEDTAYWDCQLACNQHCLAEDISDNPRKTSFCRALKSCTGLVLILDQGVVALNRIWVCFEVSLALEERNMSLAVGKRNKGKSGKHFLLDVAAMDSHGEAHLITDGLVGAEERREPALGFLIKGQREAKFPSEILQKAARVDIASAEASRPEDKIVILNSIRFPRAKTKNLFEDASSLGRYGHPSLDALGNAMREKLEETEKLSSVANDLSCFFRENKEKTDGVEKLVQDMDDELWNEQDDTVQKFFPKFVSFEWSKEAVEQKAQQIRALHSHHAGVSMTYLLQDFLCLAQQRSQETDPTFLRLKEVFWLCYMDKIGQNVVCPRDGKLGCAFVDLLSPTHRQRQNYFMSWSWQYSVGQVFEENLRRCGQMLAILDGWHQPRYLRRVWTIYEQYMACSLKIDVAFVMPHEASASLSQKISLGDKGIAEVTRSLCEVNVANAEAYDPRDEKKVKDTIRESVGFQEVNRYVKSAMVQWIGGVVKDKFEKLVNETGEECEDTEDTFFV